MDRYDKAQAESQARGTWREQVPEKKFSVHPNSSGGSNEESEQSEYFSERVLRTNRAGQNPFGSINLQLVERLIWQASDRLKEAKDCIELYESQVSKLTREIEELEKLKQLAENQVADEEE